MFINKLHLGSSLRSPSVDIRYTDLLEVVNTSLLSGTFPNSLKTAVVKPLLKKRNFDSTMLSNYRPISNNPFIGKIIEKVVFKQLNKYLNSNGYLDNFQSGSKCITA